MKTPLCFLFLSITGIHPSLADPPAAPTPQIRTAAENGDAEALFQMARALLYGRGVPRDPDAAYQLMLSSAGQGHVEATGAMGYFHITGIGTKKNAEKAMEWYRKGAELGSAKAQLNLARLLLEAQDAAYPPPAKNAGEAEENAVEGIDWLKKSAAQGLPEAGESLGTHYFHGQHGLPRNRKQAMRWFETPAKAGSASSQNYMGVLNDPGIPGGKADAEAAEHWYRKSAIQGNAKAQANLGRLLDMFSENQDRRVEAIAWTLVAEQNDEITAKRRLIEFKPALSDQDLRAARTRAREINGQIRKQQDPAE